MRFLRQPEDYRPSNSDTLAMFIIVMLTVAFLLSF